MIESKYFFIATIFILSILIIVLLVIWIRERSGYIQASQCNKPLGEFALENGVTTKSVLSKCGPDKKSLCSESNITSLTQAVQYCNDNIDICDRFSYDSLANIVQIVSLGGKYIPLATSDIYTRQVGITLR